MKRTFPLLVLFCLLLTRPAAGQVYFSENFDQMIPYVIRPPWLHNYTFAPWQVGQPSLLGLFQCFDIPNENGYNKVAAVSDCNVFGNYDNSNVLLETPVIDLAGATVPWLETDVFFRKVSAGGITERATIEVSTDSGTTWTILKDLAATPDAYAFKTLRLDLSAYAGRRIRLGFRYTDNNAPANMPGCAIDNIRVFQPPLHDLALTAVSPDEPLLSYMVEQQYAFLKGTVTNLGRTPVTSFSVQYREGSGAIRSHQVTGVSIAMFDTLHFVHSVAYIMPDRNTHQVTMSVQLPGDNDTSNDHLPLALTGCAFMPVKVSAVEQTTGTWNMYAPRGIVYFNNIDTGALPANLISIHAADPMDNTDYERFVNSRGANSFNYQPSIFIDWRRKLNPDLLLRTFRHEADFFGFADLDLQITAISNTSLTVQTQVLPAIDMSGDYRLAIVLTEDHLHGNSAGWEQRNIYHNPSAGVMGGFESRPDPVPAADMYYDHVARSAYPAPEGAASSLPQDLYAGNPEPAVFTLPLDPSWQQRNMQVTALLINMADSTVLNSRRIPLSSVGIVQSAQAELRTAVYPNPAHDRAWLSLELPRAAPVSVTMTDLSGKTVRQLPPASCNAGMSSLSVPVAALPPGLYLVQVQAGQIHRTLKLTLLP